MKQESGLRFYASVNVYSYIIQDLQCPCFDSCGFLGSGHVRFSLEENFVGQHDIILPAYTFKNIVNFSVIIAWYHSFSARLFFLTVATITVIFHGKVSVCSRKSNCRNVSLESWKSNKAKICFRLHMRQFWVGTL